MYTSEEIDNFNYTFSYIILENTSIYYNEETFNTIENQQYNKVLDYYLNYENDETSKDLKLILGTQYTSESAMKTVCGCTNDVVNNNTLSKSCYDKYKEGIELLTAKMLGDAQFYFDWIYVRTLDTDYYIPAEFIDNLIELVQALIDSGKDLSFDESKRKLYCVCAKESTKSEENYKILKNYLKVLDWVKNCQLQQNINKIKVYGEEFGKLFPKLLF